MAYQDFAYCYDILNQEADYNSLFQYIHNILLTYNVKEGIIADLGCGTGEMALRLSSAGYDVIAIDKSVDMLSVFRDKIADIENQPDILMLCQDLTHMDLYGTYKAAVSTFDTFNHIPRNLLEQALQKIHLFLEPGGIFIFDANSPYKHQHVLSNNQFDFTDDDGFYCTWKNNYNKEENITNIHIFATLDNEMLFDEHFIEYIYSLDNWQEMLHNAGFVIQNIVDGENFMDLQPQSQRFLITALKPKE